MFYGLDDKIDLFKKLIRENNLRQSYLFFGEPQVGKFSFACNLINFLETGEFVSPSETRPLFDAKIFSPDESGSIGIDAVRDLKKFLYQRPIVSSRRSAVFDSAEALTPEAQNALLKIIEEPPQFSLIIFVSRDPSIFPPTLASRFVKVYFPRLKQKAVEKYLKANFKISPEAAILTAKQSFGRIGRAVQLLQKSSKKDSEPESLSDYLEETILSLRRNLLKNSSKMRWLLKREELVGRYNVNPKLQFKAVSQYLRNE